MDILTGENLSSNLLANMDIMNWSVRSTSIMGGDREKGLDGGYQ